MFCVSQFKSFIQIYIYMYLCNVSFNTDASFVLWLLCVWRENTPFAHAQFPQGFLELEKFLKICSNTICVKDAYHWPCCVWITTRECWKHSCRNHSYSCPFQLNASTPCNDTIFVSFWSSPITSNKMCKAISFLTFAKLRECVLQWV